jgi:hypothetical protein
MTPIAKQFDEQGFASVAGALPAVDCLAIIERLSALVSDISAGTRCLLPQPWCVDLARRLRDDAALAACLPAGHVAVQCTYFEKSAARNWLVAVHQDLSVPVAERIDAPGWRGWCEKEGSVFSQPPAELLEQLIAVRLHLDDCGPDDGPLRVVPGSHRLGLLSDDEAIRRRDEGPVVSCTARPDDALVLRPLLLHASSKATGRSLRRVLHFVFGPPALPHGLRWAQAV